MISTEHVIADTPFTVRRIVKWGQCDPAGVVYTVAFGEYVISTAELFYAHLMGQSPQRGKDHHDFGTPTRALSFDFQRSLRPDDQFDTIVTIGEIRNSTFELVMTATNEALETVFIARLIPVCIFRGERKSRPLPNFLREALETYKARTQTA